MALQEKALAKLPEVERPERALTLHETLNLGEVLYKSGYFKDISSAAQAVVKILRGQELGIGPVGSLEGVYVVEGKTALGAGLIGSLIKRSGRYDYKILELTDQGCKIAFLENGKQIGVTSFTEEDAKRAGLLGKSSWQKYPRNMYFARALSNGARWYCPDVFAGAVYTPEELSDKDVIDAEALVIDEEPKDTQPQTTSAEPVQPKPAQDKPTPKPESNGEKHNQRFWDGYWQSWVNAGLASSRDEARELAHKLAGVDSVANWSTKDLNGLLQLAIANKRAKGQVA